VPNLKLVLEYAGTAYHGWQIQPGVPTIQGTLQRCLAIVLREPVVARGAARTDAGVHALGQVASVASSKEIDPRRLRRSLNAILPEDIAVREAQVVPDSFHARHSALGRIYRYTVSSGDHLSPFHRQFTAHTFHPLDVEAMDRAARSLVGTRDFSSFKAAGDLSDSPVKDLRSSRVTREGERGELVVYTVEATSFLQHMVRNIAGTLIEVGRGRILPDRVPEILEARDRRAAGPTAPAQGLMLVEVLYPDLARPGSG